MIRVIGISLAVLVMTLAVASADYKPVTSYRLVQSPAGTYYYEPVTTYRQVESPNGTVVYRSGHSGTWERVVEDRANHLVIRR